MSRKDYIAIAAVLRSERPDAADVDAFERDPWASGTCDLWCTTVLAFARMLADQAGYDLNGNRRFDRSRFLAACGYAS